MKCHLSYWRAYLGKKTVASKLYRAHHANDGLAAEDIDETTTLFKALSKFQSSRASRVVQRTRYMSIKSKYGASAEWGRQPTLLIHR